MSVSAAGSPNGHIPHILVVDDSPADVRLAREVLKDTGIAHTLHVAVDGEKALALLADPATPPMDLILLDINLPRMKGPEVLAVIKTDKRLRRIPVIMLSTSQDEGDIARCYDAHANAFVTKPVEWDDFEGFAKALGEFWLHWVRLPRGA